MITMVPCLTYRTPNSLTLSTPPQTSQNRLMQAETLNAVTVAQHTPNNKILQQRLYGKVNPHSFIRNAILSAASGLVSKSAQLKSV